MLRLVTYDLHKPKKDYEKLFEALKTYDWAHPLGSVWFLKTQKTASEIRDHLKQYIDGNDSLIVTSVDDWSTLNIHRDVTVWLKR